MSLIFVVAAIFVLIGITSVTVTMIMRKKQEEKWKLNYLNKVYPLSKDKLNPNYFDSLEFLITAELPENKINELKKSSFKSYIPGPSCEALPCRCDENDPKMPGVFFDPDPIWDNKWPPCSWPTADGRKCCESVDSFKKCLAPFISVPNNPMWANFNTWTAFSENKMYDPPNIGQFWKPMFFPLFTALKSTYHPKNWHYNIDNKGFENNSIVEVVRAYFPTEDGMNNGVWFYYAKGSGIGLDMGKTLKAKNKVHALRLLDSTVLKNFFNNLTTQVFWDGRGVSTSIKDYIKSLIDNKTVTSNDEIIDCIINSEKYTNINVETLYNINRIANCGDLDYLIHSLIDKLHLPEQVDINKKYRTIQLMAQPNLYNGWAFEIIYRGDNLTRINSIANVPKEHIRTFNPLKPNESGPCTYDTNNYRFSYCNEIPAWLNSKVNAKQNVSGWETCMPPFKK